MMGSSAVSSIQEVEGNYAHLVSEGAQGVKPGGQLGWKLLGDFAQGIRGRRQPQQRRWQCFYYGRPEGGGGNPDV